MQHWIETVRLWLLSRPPGEVFAYLLVVVLAAASIFVLGNGRRWPRARRSRRRLGVRGTVASSLSFNPI
jgi:hypothetical protein